MSQPRTNMKADIQAVSDRVALLSAQTSPPPRPQQTPSQRPRAGSSTTQGSQTSRRTRSKDSNANTMGRSTGIPRIKFTWVAVALSLSLAAILASLTVVSVPRNAGHVQPVRSEVGRLPVMGYNTWNAYHCDINEDVILKTAHAMVDLGLSDLGYKYVNIDDCWSDRTRNQNGDLAPNATLFPRGFNWLTDHIHSLGLKAGIYGDSGWYTCQMFPGSFENEERDAKQFNEWGFDLLKYDNCAEPFDEIIREGMVGKFGRMAAAIKEVSETRPEPMIFSLCQWGREQPWLWAREYGQMWRMWDDIGPVWEYLMNIINKNSFIAWASDFYGFNDLDILEVGNEGLNYEEQKSHFTAWALMKSPLLIGTDLTQATEETLSILKNEEIIAINQDPIYGTSIVPFRWGIGPDWVSNGSYPAQYWSGKSQNGTVFMLLNTLDTSADMTFQLTESPWIRAGIQYTVRDLWTHTDNGTAVRSFTAKAVPPHGVVALLLKEDGPEPPNTSPPCAIIEWCTAENGTRYD